MMFFFHTAFSLELLTLCAGAALYIWSARNNGAGTTLARILGFVVILFSLISIACTSYTNYTMWQEMRGHEPMMLHGMDISKEEKKIEQHEKHKEAKKHEKKTD